MSKTITIKIKVRPFTVPNFILIDMPPKPRQDGIHDLQENKLSLSDLDASTLHEMCEEFANAVFAKAGKSRPKTSN